MKKGRLKQDKDMEFHLDLSQAKVEHLPLLCFLNKFEADYVETLVHEFSMLEIYP